MTNPYQIHIDYFNRILESWKTAIGHVLVESVAVREQTGWLLLSARVFLSAFPMPSKADEVISVSAFRFARERVAMDVEELSLFVKNLRAGHLLVHDTSLNFPGNSTISEYVPTSQNEPEFFTPQLQVRSESRTMQSRVLNYSEINSELRAGEMPFDGLIDALDYFGFGQTAILPHEHQITLTIQPPGDLRIDECSLSQNTLKISLQRKTSFAPDDFGVGLRQHPDPVTGRRKQLTDSVMWSNGKEEFQDGALEIELDSCAMAEVFITAGGFSVRRAQISDPAKSLNHRLAAYRFIDPGLQQLEKFLYATKKEARELEDAVATLFFLQGASALLPLPTDSPDIVIETRAGRLAVVECTIRSDNLREKVGKLIRRRENMILAEEQAEINRPVLSILVVNQERRTVAKEEQYLVDNQIVLLTVEDLRAMVAELPFHFDFDKFFVGKLKLFMRSSQNIFDSLPLPA
ncbi:hypothetical protein [Massilia sp. YIM B04103]|uniref:hypothetical protein n=1 Tax=Massilia sp. YIM B04103 TaxID=2963106 RepID=UPI00210C4A5C|nr:hypothetical protein [Massilia sp. YIM B04103]